MRIQREIDLALRRAHAAIGYAELDVWRATTDHAKAEANVALATARRALAEAVFVSTCHVRHFVLAPYLDGHGPKFRITAVPSHWELFILPEGDTPILLAEGDEYPVTQGAMMPYDEPKTIGSLLAFLVAYHPASGSGAYDPDERAPARYWVGKAALDLAAPHLDNIEMEAAEMENPHECEDDDDDAEHAW